MGLDIMECSPPWFGILSILASAAAGFIAATNESALPGTAPTIAALSGAAATLTTISTFTGCASKWRTNRKTRSALQILQSELHGDATESQRKRFSEIMEAHELGILGAEPGKL